MSNNEKRFILDSGHTFVYFEYNHSPCVRLVVASLDNLGGGNERTIWEDITKQFKVKR